MKSSASLNFVSMSPSRGGWGRNKEKIRSAKSIFIRFNKIIHILKNIKNQYNPLNPPPACQSSTVDRLVGEIHEIDQFYSVKLVNSIKLFSNKQQMSIFG